MNKLLSALAAVVAFAGLSPASAQSVAQKMAAVPEKAALAPNAAPEFNPRALRFMPTREQIPDPRMSADEITAACLKYFGGKTYIAAVSVEGDKSREQLWNDTITGKFTTNGTLHVHSTMGRLVCSVKYAASTRWVATDYLGAFDGKVFWSYRDAKNAGAGGYILRPNPDGTLEYTAYRISQSQNAGRDRITKGTFELR